MFAFRSTLKLSSLLALALLAACGVSAGGAIPCADDSSCPIDYPVCDVSAGKCIAGTPSPSSAATVQIIAVTRDDGAQSSAAITGTATVTVLARASAGVVKDSVKVTANGKDLAPIASTPPTFTFKLDTAVLFPAPGVDQTAVTLKAAMRTGDQPTVDVASADKVIQVDDKAPTLSAPQLVSADLKPGAALEIDVSASEALSSLTGTVSAASVIDGALTEVSVQGNVHRLSAPVLATAVNGTYSITITARDAAGNQGTLPVTPSFTVHTPGGLTSGNLSLSTPRNVTLGGVLAATAGDVIHITVSLPSSIVLAPGALPSVSVGPAGTAGTALAVAASGSVYTAAYPISAQADGNYVVSLSVTDIAGNVSAPVTRSFLISKTAPLISGGITLASPIAGPNAPLQFSFVSPPGDAAAATVNNNPATCTGSEVILCTYLPTDADVASGTFATGVAVVATVTDALGNFSTAAATVTLDAQPPTFNAAALSLVDVLPGNLITLNVLPSEAITGLTATVSGGGAVVGSMNEIAVPSPDGTRHLGYSVPATLINDTTYSVSVTALDLAANSAVPLVRTFTFHAPFTLGAASLTLTTTASIFISGTLAATAGTVVNASLLVPPSTILAAGSQPTFTLSSGGGAQTPLAVSGSNPFTARYTVSGNDADGTYQVTATVTDIAGNHSSVSRQFIVNEAVPVIAGGITLGTPVAGPNLPVQFSFVAPAGTTGSATVNGHAANCSGTTVLSCTYTPTTSDVATGSVATGVPVRASVRDALGNTGTASTTVTLDAKLPALTVTVVGPINLTDGELVQIDVATSESLSSLTARLDTGAALNEIAPATGSTHHFGHAILSTEAEGPHAVTFTATDLALNVTVLPQPGIFSVRHPFSVGQLAVSTGMTLNMVAGAVATATAGTVVQLSVTLPSTATFSGSGLPAFVFTTSGGTVHALPPATVASGATTTVYSSSYTVSGSDSDGLAGVSVTATDVAGNTSSATSSVLIDKSAPTTAGFVANKTFVDAVNKLVTFTGVASKRLQSATVSTTDGDSGTCTCDGGVCSAATSATPLVSCTVTVSNAATTGNVAVTATLALKDLLGNSSPATAAYQAQYTVVPPPAAGSLAAGAATVTAGVATTLTPVFSHGTALITNNVDGATLVASSGIAVSVAPTNLTTYVYTLTVTNPAGTVDSSQHASVTVVGPPTASITADKTNVSAGATVTLTVHLTGGTGVLTASVGSPPTGAVTDGATFTVTPNASTLYTLTVTNTAGTAASSSVLVNVGATPSVSLTANPTTIAPGQSAVLTANASAAVSATIDPGSISVIPNGSNRNSTVSPTVTTTYTLTAVNSAGLAVSTTATVTVTPAAATSLTATASTVNAGATPQLTPVFGGFGATATISLSTNPAARPCGSTIVSGTAVTCTAVSATTTYMLTVTAGSSTSTTSATVTVLQATVLGFTAAASPINAGSTPQLTATFSPTSGSPAATAVISLSTDSSSRPCGPSVSSGTPVTCTAISSDTTYVLTVSAGITSDTSALTVTTTQPTAALVAASSTISAGAVPQLTPTFGPAGASATISLSTDGTARPCGSSLTSNQAVSCAAINANTTYVLTVALGTSVVTAQTTVATTAANITSFVATAANVNAGTAPQLTPTFGPSGATGVISLSTDSTARPCGAAATSGTAVTCTAINAATTYVLAVTAGTTTATKTAVVTVTPASVTSFVSAASPISAGAAPQLTPTFGPANATAVISLSTDGTARPCGPSATSGLQTTCTAISANTTYVLTVTAGTTTASAAVTVAVTGASVTSFLATTSPVNAGSAPQVTAIFGPTGATGVVSLSTDSTARPCGPSVTSGTAATCAAISTATTYVLTVTAGTTSAVSTVSVSVTPASVTSFVAAVSPVDPGTAPLLTATFAPSTATAVISLASNSAARPCGSSATSGTQVTCTAINANTTYVLTVTAGTTTASANLIVAVNPASVTSFQAASSPIDAGAQPQLTASFGPTSATGVISLSTDSAARPCGASATSGTQVTCTAINSNTTYVLTVSVGTTTATSSVTVAVTSANVTSFVAASAVVNAGAAPKVTPTFGPGSATAVISLSTDSTARPCGNSVTSGTQLTCAVINANVTYVLTVTAGTTTATATLAVTATAANITGFSAAASPVASGTQPLLTPTFGPAGSPAATATITLADGSLPCGSSITSGTQVTCSAINNNTTYTLTVTAGTTVSKSTVTVAVKPYITSFVADKLFQPMAGGAPQLTPDFGPANATATITVGATNPCGASISPGVPVTCASISSTTTYVLTVSANGAASVNQPLIVTVSPDPSTATLTTPKNPLTRSDPQPTTINFTFCAGCTAQLFNGSTSTPFGASGSTTAAITQTTSFTLSVTNQAGEVASKGLTIVLDPGSFSATGAPGTERFGATSTLLPNGKVLITGGRTAAGTANSAVKTAEIYDPATGTFHAPIATSGTATMQDERYEATATLLGNGLVLVTGGQKASGGSPAVASADLFDPTNEGFVVATPSAMNVARSGHTASLLADGKVLIAGGQNSQNSGATTVSSAEIYDPASNSFGAVLASSMNQPRFRHTATVLSDGRVLLVGGAGSNKSVDLFSHANNTFTTATGSLQQQRTAHTATLLSDGTLLLVGGTAGVAPLAEVGVISANTVAFTATTGAAAVSRNSHTATLLPNGLVLIAGGYTGAGSSSPTNSAELYDPHAGVFNPTGTMGVARAEHTAAFTFSGKALFVGGDAAGLSAELFDPN
jgi:hypothetical protein